MVSFRPGHGPEETEEQQMDLLSAAVSFLVANGNNATDEVGARSGVCASLGRPRVCRRFCSRAGFRGSVSLFPRLLFGLVRL